MKKQSYKEIERQRREDDILAAAEKLLIERGFANLNMDDLANVVGISKPTLYQHFKGKDELAVRVLMRSYKAMGEFLSRPLDEPAIQRLTTFIRHSLNLHAPGNIFANLRGEMRPEVMMKMLRNNPIIVKGRECFIQNLYTLVDKAKQEGSIDPSIPTPVVTHTLLTLNHSLSDPTLSSELANSPERMESAVESVVRVFLYGVTADTVKRNKTVE